MGAALTRREFLQLAAAAGAGVTVLSSGRSVAAARSRHAAGVAGTAILIDIARCIGCRSCEAACKAYHRFPAGEAQDLSPTAWTYVRTQALRTPRPHLNLGAGGAGRRTFKVQCMHCLEPACASACPVAALQKTPQGPVTYDASRCIGCRYCMVACPFQIPRFEWRKPLPTIAKCNMCAERQKRGERPACVEACPVQALQFGPRAAMLAEATQRIGADPRYVPQIYGAEEVGGTSILYVSDVPFEELGFPVVTREPLPAYTWRVLGKLPGIVLTLGALLTAVEMLARRQQQGPRTPDAGGEA